MSQSGNIAPVTLYDASGNALSVQDGVAIPANTPALLMAGSDGVNARRLLVSATGVLSVDGSATTLTQTQLAAELDEKFSDLGQQVMAGSASVVLASNQSTVPVDVSDRVGRLLGVLSAGASIVGKVGLDAANLAGVALDATVAAVRDRLPAALVGGRLDVNEGSWLGSTAPTVGQKAAAASLPVTLATEQTGADNSTNSTNKVAALVARANAAAPAWTENNQVPNSSDLLGNQRTKLSGVQSALAANSTTTPLGIAGVFTGTWEDVSDYAAVQFIAFADQASAASGFSIQWSPDGTNADVTDVTNLSASAGRGFMLTPRGRFFRVVYTNGAVAQGVFRLRTVYHVNGVGLITRLLSATITEDNFAQNVRAFLAGKNAAGNFNNLIADADNSANAAIKLATIPARANAADPAWTEGNQVPASTDLAGFQRAKVKFNTPTTAALSSASINAAASGNNTLVAAVAAQTVRVFRLFLVVAGTVDIIFRDGAATGFTGTMSFSKNGSMTIDFDGEPWFVTTAGNAFILNLSAAVQVSGRVYYTQS